MLLDLVEGGVIEGVLCVDPVAAQCVDESHCLPVPIRHLGQVLVHEDQAPRIGPALKLLPLLASSGDLGPQAL